MQNKNAKKLIIATVALISAVTSIQLPATAGVISDPTTIYRLQARRNDLLQRETKLLRDRDDLNKQIDDMRKRGESNYVLNDLCQRLDVKYMDLQKTRIDLREVDKYLL